MTYLEGAAAAAAAADDDPNTTLHKVNPELCDFSLNRSEALKSCNDCQQYFQLDRKNSFDCFDSQKCNMT
jgi:hypothetical protein